jgi:hypothetical protein
MNFVVIFGPPAVGKMTVGYSLSHLTGYKLFHNHMTIELILNFFPYRHPQHKPLVHEFRRRIFEEVAKSDLPGLIFTCVWALEQSRSKAEIDSYCTIFRQQGGEVYFVELEANQAERIKRNRSTFRLDQKASKRDTAGSEKYLLDVDQRHKLNTENDFFYPENYLKINNTILSPQETAHRIVGAFGFHPPSIAG